MAAPVSVIVVDDHPIFRKGLAQTIAKQPDFAVVAESATAHDAVALVSELAPDIALLDLSMPGGGLSAIDGIVALGTITRIVVLTASEDDDDVVAAFRRGAHAYLLKGMGAESLITVLRSVAAGATYVPPQLATRVIANSHPPANAATTANLTDRETAIVRLVATGQSNKEIARRLGLEEKTVKNHMTSILRKLNLRNRTEAALVAKTLFD